MVCDPSVRFPDHPRCAAACPELFKLIPVAERIHGLPKAVMTIDRELAFARQRFHRFVLPGRMVALDIAGDFWRQHKETAVDPPAIANRLFLKSGHQPSGGAQGAKSA